MKIKDFKNLVSFSGDYNQLTNKPTVPTALSQLTTDTNNQRVSETEKTNLPTSTEKTKIVNTINFTYFL